MLLDYYATCRGKELDLIAHSFGSFDSKLLTPASKSSCPSIEVSSSSNSSSDSESDNTSLPKTKKLRPNDYSIPSPKPVYPALTIAVKPVISDSVFKTRVGKNIHQSTHMS